MTADSTSRDSHFQGARRVPETMAEVESWGSGCWVLGAGFWFGVLGSSDSAPKSSSGETTHTSLVVTSPAPACGTWARDKYSAKRFAERFSTAQLNIARNARPAG